MKQNLKKYGTLHDIGFLLKKIFNIHKKNNADVFISQFSMYWHIYFIIRSPNRSLLGESFKGSSHSFSHTIWHRIPEFACMCVCAHAQDCIRCLKRVHSSKMMSTVIWCYHRILRLEKIKFLSQINCDLMQTALGTWNRVNQVCSD